MDFSTSKRKGEKSPIGGMEEIGKSFAWGEVGRGSKWGKHICMVSVWNIHIHINAYHIYIYTHVNTRKISNAIILMKKSNDIKDWSSPLSIWSLCASPQQGVFPLCIIWKWSWTPDTLGAVKRFTLKIVGGTFTKHRKFIQILFNWRPLLLKKHADLKLLRC